MRNISINFLVKIPIHYWDINKKRQGITFLAHPVYGRSYHSSDLILCSFISSELSGSECAVKLPSSDKTVRPILRSDWSQPWRTGSFHSATTAIQFRWNEFSWDGVRWEIECFSALKSSYLQRLDIVGWGQEGQSPCKNVRCGAGVVICLDDLHMVQLMPLPPRHLLLH